MANKNTDTLRKNIEANASTNKFLNVVMAENSYFLKTFGATKDPLKSLVDETISSAGVRSDLTADEKEIISGALIKALDSLKEMPKERNNGSVKRAKHFFDRLWDCMLDDKDFSAIVSSYLDDVMMEDLKKETSDTNLLAAICMWVACRSVLIPIVPIDTDATPVAPTEQAKAEEPEKVIMIEEKVEEKVVGPKTAEADDGKKKEAIKILDDLESAVNEFISTGKEIVENGEMSKLMEKFTKAAEKIQTIGNEAEEKFSNIGDIKVEASTAYKDENGVNPESEQMESKDQDEMSGGNNRDELFRELEKIAARMAADNIVKVNTRTPENVMSQDDYNALFSEKVPTGTSSKITSMDGVLNLVHKVAGSLF